jgi:hypothetical protein
LRSLNISIIPGANLQGHISGTPCTTEMTLVPYCSPDHDAFTANVKKSIIIIILLCMADMQKIVFRQVIIGSALERLEIGSLLLFLSDKRNSIRALMQECDICSCDQLQRE